MYVTPSGGFCWPCGGGRYPILSGELEVEKMFNALLTLTLLAASATVIVAVRVVSVWLKNKQDNAKST
jgi:hypothetical protein